jgi:hypothetical protein
MKREEIIKQIIQTKEFSNNKEAKKILENTLKFINKHKKTTTANSG